MADEFNNTILAVGDNEVLDQFITRRIDTYRDNIIKTSGAYAFHSCIYLTLAELPNMVNIAAYCFNNCSNLSSVDLPNATSMGDEAFSHCTSLTEIFLPNVRSTGYNAFNNCTALKKADFYMCDTLSPNTFIKCTAFDTLILRRTDTITKLGNITAFSETKITDGGTGYIYVPRVLFDVYTAASNWSTFANQFRAIEDYPDICGE